MKKPEQEKLPERLTVLLSADLARSLLAEKARIEAETGFTVSMTQVASRAMQKGIAAPSRP